MKTWKLEYSAHIPTRQPETETDTVDSVLLLIQNISPFLIGSASSILHN